jgi:nuclear pore complex protein Nup53
MHQHTSPFSVAGMPSSTSSHHLHHSQHQPSWGGGSFQPGGSTFGESLSGGSSRSLYQSGYLMGARNTDPNSQPSLHHTRLDGEPPIVQTKAKMNHVLARSSTDSFGMDSMFDSTNNKRASPRGHLGMAQDEDAPPMRSVNDMEEDMFGADSGFGGRKSQVGSWPRFISSALFSAIFLIFIDSS